MVQEKDIGETPSILLNEWQNLLTYLVPGTVVGKGVQSKIRADMEYTQVLEVWLRRCVLDGHSASH